MTSILFADYEPDFKGLSVFNELIHEDLPHYSSARQTIKYKEKFMEYSDVDYKSRLEESVKEVKQ